MQDATHIMVADQIRSAFLMMGMRVRTTPAYEGGSWCFDIQLPTGPNHARLSGDIRVQVTRTVVTLSEWDHDDGYEYLDSFVIHRAIEPTIALVVDLYHEFLVGEHYE